ncbi:MAG: protein BatD [Calditrichaeota bacterium]|nr:protein BatD [Calditrichota bacterium]MCB9391158.1 protein BatD [Calditrichota bacterium]
MRLALVAALLLASLQAFAQLSFEATPSRTTVPAGEPFEVTFTFNGAARGLPTPQPNQLSNVTLIGGPSTSTQTSNVNGRVTSSKSFTYVFSGGTPGPAVIGPVDIAYGGRKYSTPPISITVVKAGERQRGTAQDVFIEVIPDKRDAYVGEQIILTYKLYFSASIYAPEIKELPKATGFWTEEFELPDKLVPRDEVVEGQSYKSIVFRKAALFATTAGDLTVDPLTAVVQVERRKNSSRGRDPFFDDPFFSLGRRRESVQVSSRALKLAIKPLPDSGRPEGDVAVGRFTATARVDKQEVSLNDAVTLTVQIRGTGNIRTLPIPEIRFPTDFETYEPRTSDQIRRGPDKISGTKTFEFVLIPRAAGTQTIPSVSYKYFDPQTQKYETAETSPISIEVGRGKGSSGAQQFESKREVKSVGQDIAYVKAESGEISLIGVLPHERLGTWALIASPWVAMAGLAFALRRNAETSRTLSSRRRRTLKSARARLTHAERFASTEKLQDSSRELALAVQDVFSEWTDLSSATHTIQEWEKEWRSRGFSDEHWITLKSALSASERSRFAGGQASRAEMHDAIQNVRSVLVQLESAS